MATRSRNHRSWEVTTAQPGKSSSASSSDGQGLDVEVVGRLVEQQQVAAHLQGQRQVEPVALAAGEDAGLLLLVGALEAERRDVGAGVHLEVGDLDEVEPVGDDLPDVLVRVDAAAALVDVGDLDRLADLELALVGLLLRR